VITGKMLRSKMSVEINYTGNGLGNVLYQYVYARLLAEKNNLYLKTKFPYQQIFKTSEHKNGLLLETPVITIRDVAGCEDGEKFFNAKLAPAHYILSGYFQTAVNYSEHADKIKSFFIIDDFKKNTEDIVMHVRLADFGKSPTRKKAIIVEPQWYLNILKNERFSKLHIVGSRKGEPYLDFFKKYNPIVFEPDGNFGNFRYIRRFDKIIGSNSTYCIWATFFSNATKIYAFCPRKFDPYIKTFENWKSSWLKYTDMIEGNYWENYCPKTFYER